MRCDAGFRCSNLFVCIRRSTEDHRTERERIEPIEKFYVDYRLTSLKRGEMVTGVVLPHPPPGTGTAFFNLVRTHADIAKISVAVVVFVQNGICREVRIAIGAAAPTVFRAVKAEALFTGRKITPEVDE